MNPAVTVIPSNVTNEFTAQLWPESVTTIKFEDAVVSIIILVASSVSLTGVISYCVLYIPY